MNRQPSKPNTTRSPKPTPKKASLPQEGLLQVVVVSYCKPDVLLVDEVSRKPLGRPYLTLAMDVFSRTVTGFALSMEAPSIGICIAHSILPKDGWLLQRQIEASWPIRGVPATIMVDNALEFRSPDLAKACAAFGINIAWRPLGSPQYAVDESFMFSFSKELKKVPASTLSMTELEQWIAQYVAIYHNTMNSHILATPLDKFNEGIRTSGIPPRMEEGRVYLNFLPTRSVTVQKYGICFKGQTYSSPVLAPHLGIKDPVTKRAVRHQVRYNPRDLDQIYFYDAPTKAYHKIPRQVKVLPPSVKAFSMKRAKAPATAQWAEAKRRWECVEPLLKAGNKRTKALVSKQAKKFGYVTAALYRWLDILTTAKSPSFRLLLPL